MCTDAGDGGETFDHSGYRTTVPSFSESSLGFFCCWCVFCCSLLPLRQPPATCSVCSGLVCADGGTGVRSPHDCHQNYSAPTHHYRRSLFQQLPAHSPAAWPMKITTWRWWRERPLALDHIADTGALTAVLGCMKKEFFGGSFSPQICSYRGLSNFPKQLVDTVSLTFFSKLWIGVSPCLHPRLLLVSFSLAMGPK